MCRMRIATVILILFTLVMSGCIDSKVQDTPSKRKALAAEVAQLMLSSGGFDALMEQAVDQAMQVFAANMHTELGRELSHSEYEKFRKAFSESFEETFPAQTWESPFSDLYAKHFNSDDLTKLLAFYETEAGAKFLRAQHVLTKDGAEMGVKLIESKEEEFSKLFSQKVAIYAE
jgi:hypothetical protein